VRDIVNGLLLACERGRRGEIYILSGTHATLAAAREAIQSVADVHTAHLTLPWRLALAFAAGMQSVYRLTGAAPKFTPYSLHTLAENAHFTSAKAREELGYGTRPLTDTFRDMLAWRLSPLSGQPFLP
jgi:dihydroflavonol-4-reductase